MRVLLATILLAAFIAADMPVLADSYTPGVYNLLVSQGEDFRRLLVIHDGAKRPVNLTGYSFRGTVRAQPTALAALATIATETDAATGKVWLIIPRSVTSAIGGKTGYWDLQMTYPDGSVTYLLKGQFSCAATATR